MSNRIKTVFLVEAIYPPTKLLEDRAQLKQLDSQITSLKRINNASCSGTTRTVGLTKTAGSSSWINKTIWLSTLGELKMENQMSSNRH